MARAMLPLWLLAVLVGYPSAAGAQDAAADRGKQLFMEHGCYGCHAVGVVGSAVGPDLSRVGARYGEAQLAAWLRDPRQQKPTAHMPRIELSERDVRALAAYLASLR